MNVIRVLDLQVLGDAIMHILSYIQSQSDYENVLQHMSPQGGKSSSSIAANEKRLYAALGEYGRYLVKQDPDIKVLVDNLAKEVIYPKVPAINQPVQPNQKVLAHV